MKEAIARYVTERRAAGYVEIGALTRVLSRLLSHFSERLSREPFVGDLSPRDLDAVADVLTAERTQNATRRVIGILKMFSRWLMRRGLVLLDPGAHLVLPKPPKRSFGLVPSREDVARLIALAAPENALLREGLAEPLPFRRRRRDRERLARRQALVRAEALRDVALLELLYGSGMRFGEALTLDLSDLDLSERTAFIKSGKGKKDRLVPLTKEAVRTLQRYLAEEGRGALGGGYSGSRALFLGTTGRRLWACVWSERRLRPLLAGASLPKSLSPHRLRHACAVHLVESGADVVFVKRLLGHDRLATTAIYLDLSTAAVDRALLAAHPREKGLVFR